MKKFLSILSDFLHSLREKVKKLSLKNAETFISDARKKLLIILRRIKKSLRRLKSKDFSLIISVLIHAVFILILLSSFNSRRKTPAEKYVEIGFGGTTESNSPGSPGGGIVEQKKLKNIKPEIKKEEIKKKKKEVEAEPKTITSPVAEDTGKILATKEGNSGGGNSNGKPGSGGTGNGANGSGPPKKGVMVNQDIYYVAVDLMPVPVGGMNNLKARVIYPPAASAHNIHGTVYVQAFIDELGIVRKTSLLKGLGYGCDQAAMNAIRQTRFEAGELHGIPVKVQMTIPIYF